MNALKLSSIDLSACKIWLETTEDNVTYAVKATEVTFTDISSVAVTGIDMPKAGSVMDTLASCETPGISNTKPTVTWSPNDSKADYDECYVATVILEADIGYKFTDATKATVNGEPANASRNTDDTLIVAYVFPRYVGPDGDWDGQPAQ